MRTTVDIPDALYRELKSKAAREKRSVKELILRGVEVELRPHSKRRSRRITFPLVASKKPGSLEIDNAKIFDIIPFPDINVWLALSYEGHAHHNSARLWFERLDDHVRFCFCRFTQIGFLRLLTTDAVMGETEVLSQIKAWHIYDRWLEDDRIFLVEEPSAMEPRFRTLSQHKRPAPKDWSDSYLAAFAATAGLRLVTFDQSLSTKSNDAELLR